MAVNLQSPSSSSSSFVQQHDELSHLKKVNRTHGRLGASSLTLRLGALVRDPEIESRFWSNTPLLCKTIDNPKLATQPDVTTLNNTNTMTPSPWIHLYDAFKEYVSVATLKKTVSILIIVIRLAAISSATFISRNETVSPPWSGNGELSLIRNLETFLGC